MIYVNGNIYDANSMMELWKNKELKYNYLYFVG